ncbi:unnamed protein product [Lepeophtheirus salmonis]|uniref:(salmon louse) hypothetical protein n=1 Tax=Lepeophtheirus salmonis TaxID=72036 RepID=A0A7R8CPG7_LEPSM|nr:unnamed protein product [Lepeophtheirus salmonis]CAF2886384.1 unnamed protein product [Lepeophtheirus salmonis]
MGLNSSKEHRFKKTTNTTHSMSGVEGGLLLSLEQVKNIFSRMNVNDDLEARRNGMMMRSRKIGWRKKNNEAPISLCSLIRALVPPLLSQPCKGKKRSKQTMDKEQRDTNSTFNNHRSTLNCILCGGKQIYPGPRYKNHLMNEHGVLLDLTFLLQISIFKRDKGALPDLSPPSRLQKRKKKMKRMLEKMMASSHVGFAQNCPKVFRKSAHLKEHSIEIHKSDKELDTLPKRMTEEEYYQHRHGIPVVYYSCYFCKELFRGDHRLKKHLHTEHKNESFAEMVKAKEELRKVRDARKKSVKCSLCGSGCITEPERIWKKISTEATLKRFKCELCDEEIEHVRETIALHMKNSHLISWTEYQEILLKIRREDGTESSMEPFDCQVCGERRALPLLLKLACCVSMKLKICENILKEFIVYGCEDVFSKEYQLYLHLRLKHDSYDGDEEGSESNKRGLEEKCYLCRMKFFDVASLMAHISSVHDGPSKDNMSNLSGPNSNDSLSTPKNISPSNNNSIGGSFECKLCNRNFKYDRTAINEHLQAAHGINWLGYLDRIRVKADCKICDTSVKNLKEHLMTVHKLTEKEYEARESDKSMNQSALSIDQSVSQNADDFLAVETNIPKPPKSRYFSGSSTNSYPSLLKRPRVEGGNDLSSILPQLPQHPLPPAAVIEANEKTLGSHYQTTGVSRWNQCKYQCCFCKKTTQSRSSMTSHIANTHGIPIKEYKERNYPDIEVVTNWFQCRLCSTKTKFVKDCISPHLKMSHSIDIEDYERQYMRPEDWPNCQRPSGGTKSEMRNSETTTTRSLFEASRSIFSFASPLMKKTRKKSGISVVFSVRFVSSLRLMPVK